MIQAASIIQWLEDPKLLSEKERYMVDILLAKYPYFIPGHYLKAFLDNKINGKRQSVAANMLLYKGNPVWYENMLQKAITGKDLWKAEIAPVPPVAVATLHNAPPEEINPEVLQPPVLLEEIDGTEGPVAEVTDMIADDDAPVVGEVEEPVWAGRAEDETAEPAQEQYNPSETGVPSEPASEPYEPTWEAADGLTTEILKEHDLEQGVLPAANALIPEDTFAIVPPVPESEEVTGAAASDATVDDGTTALTTNEYIIADTVNNEEPVVAAIEEEPIIVDESATVTELNTGANEIPEEIDNPIPAPLPDIVVEEDTTVINVENTVSPDNSDGIVQIAENEEINSNTVEENTIIKDEVTGGFSDDVTTSPDLRDSFTPSAWSADYFMQQGINVDDELPIAEDIKTKVDKSLLVMMSYSEWLDFFQKKTTEAKEEEEGKKALKSMWQREKLAAALGEEEDEIPENVFEMAVNSLAKEEGLVSESLAEILIKQGKKDKALEMFHKLKLRNPQKSTYFAARIAEIQKDIES